jgi:hypothetical protein
MWQPCAETASSASGGSPQAACSSSPRHPCAGTQVSHVHMDLVGPLPAFSDGHLYLLNIIDRFTRWVEAVCVTWRPARA